MKIIKNHPGHLVANGKATGKVKNPFSIVEENGQMYCLMNTSSDNKFLFDLDNLPDVLCIPDHKYIPTWYVDSNGYIVCHTANHHVIYLHQYIMNHKGFGAGNLSVDHINRNKLDNRKQNLRITTQSVQNSNRGKKQRNSNACKLPEGISQKDIPIYVTYNKECYNKEKQLFREFFRIDCHPRVVNTTPSSSKSSKISIHDKLKEIKDILKSIEDGSYIDEKSTIKKRNNKPPEDSGVSVEDIPKYCHYVPAKGNRGDSFIIERHPKLTKRYIQTTSSKKKTTLEKFKLLKDLLSELES